MTASGNTAADRTGLRTDYLPALRKSLVKPMVDQEKEGIMAIIYEMQVTFLLEREGDGLSHERCPRG